MHFDLITLVACLFLFSCNIAEKDEYLTLDIANAIGNRKEVKISEIAESVEWIQLDTVDSPFIGIVNKIIEADNHLIILGKEGVSNKDMLHVYSMGGKFIRTLGEFGKGPCEYMQVSDILYDSSRKKILVLGENSKYLLEYDFEGNCDESIVETKGAMNFIYHKNCFFMHRSSNIMYFEEGEIFNQLVVHNIGSNISSRLHPAPRVKTTYLNPFIEEATFIQFKGELLYFIPLDDTIYTLSPESEKPYLVFSHGSQRFPADFKWDMEGRQKALSLKMSKITEIRHVGNLLFLNYRYAGETGLLMKHGNKIVNCTGDKTAGLLDDVDGLENITDFFTCGEHIIQVLEPYKLLEVKPNRYGFSSNVKGMISGMSESNSIILRRIKIRQDLFSE